MFGQSQTKTGRDGGQRGLTMMCLHMSLRNQSCGSAGGPRGHPYQTLSFSYCAVVSSEICCTVVRNNVSPPHCHRKSEPVFVGCGNACRKHFWNVYKSLQWRCLPRNSSVFQGCQAIFPPLRSDQESWCRYYPQSSVWLPYCLQFPVKTTFL